jgi:AraC-like DNA-binding protein/quercetin dioxygenase-like cupin family protein
MAQYGLYNHILKRDFFVIKLRSWQMPEQPMPTRMALVTHEDWLGALTGKHAAQTQIIWRLAGHQKLTTQWHLSQRQLNEHLLYLVTDGGPAKLQLADRTCQLHPGMLMWLAPGVEHQLGLAEGSEHITLYHTRFCVRRKSTDLYMEPKVNILLQAHELQWEMDQIVKELSDQQPHTAVRCRALLASLSVHALRLHDQVNRSGSSITPYQRARLMEYVRQNLTHWPRPSDLAKVIGLSDGYFARVFRQSFGQSPRQWLVEQRIHEAARLLAESNLNINQIAEHLGYRDVFLFSRQFKQVTNRTPTRYRQMF